MKLYHAVNALKLRIKQRKPMITSFKKAMNCFQKAYHLIRDICQGEGERAGMRDFCSGGLSRGLCPDIGC